MSADQGETWTKEHLGPESPFAAHYLFWAVRDTYSRLAFVPAEVDADRIIADHTQAQRVQLAVDALEKIVDYDPDVKFEDLARWMIDIATEALAQLRPAADVEEKQ